MEKSDSKQPKKAGLSGDVQSSSRSTRREFIKKCAVTLGATALGGMSLLACTRQGNSRNMPTTLKDALEGKFLIGVALNSHQFSGRAEADAAIVKEHFNSIVAENVMKPEPIQPREGEFFWDDADRFVEFGERNNMHIVGHTLIWHSQLGRWFFFDENGNDVSPEVLRQRMRTHIHAVVGRYKGRVHGWDVVNEAFVNNGAWRQTGFYRILGEEFIPLAFQYAHEADPDAELYYNDYNEWHPGKRDSIVRLANSLKARGIRIDGIGMQGHFGMGHPELAEYEAAIQAYASTGLKVMITELDMSILPSAWGAIGAEISHNFEYQERLNPFREGVPEEVYDQWTNRFLDFFKLFIKYKDHISRVTMWGVSDGGSWLNNFPVRGRTDYPLLFDRNHQPKRIVGEIIRLATES